MRYEDVMKLGEKIVDEFGLDKSCDTLGRWMAHYIAEKMAEVETATGAEAEQRKFACAETIFQFWSHRNDVLGGIRPFKHLDSILNALLSLDPDDTAPRYFRHILPGEDDGSSSETAEWLKLASGIDDTARILIRYCLAAAAGASLHRSKEWIGLADAIGKEDDLELTIVKTLINNSEALAPETPEAVEAEKIKVLVAKLDAFCDMACRLSSHFTAILSESESERR